MAEIKTVGRRQFISTSIKGGIAISTGLGALTPFIESCSSTKNINTQQVFKIGFNQAPLPYKYDALENIIDSKTMEIHYSKHAASYSKNLQEAIIAENISAGKSLEEILNQISKYSIKMRNNGGGHYNHELFWKCMQPKILNNKPTGNLYTAIEKTFGSFENFKTVFAEAGKLRFGSGWAWLYMDAAKNIKVGSTPNQDNPLMDLSEIKGVPLLALDVWEHAYYLKYQNKRADYIDNWWNVVNWNYIEQRYNKIK